MNEKVDWSCQKRHNKKNSRSYAICPFKGPKKSALMLAGINLECVKAASDEGLFNKRTKVSCIERNGKIVKHMNRNVSRFSLNQSCDIYHTELSNHVLCRPIDYAFLDFCGSLTAKVCDWFIWKLSDKIELGADIVFNFGPPVRANKFMPELLDLYKSNDEFKKHRRNMSYANLSYDFKCKRKTKVYILTFLSLFKIIFNEYDFDILDPCFYNDTQTMVMIRLGNLRRRKIPHSVKLRKQLVDFVSSFLRSRAMRSNASSVKAGKKAAKTRKANAAAYAKTRKEAARKAVETRRANVLFAKRSVAAKKAWETRRAQAE